MTTPGNDVITGTAGDDFLDGGEGDDTIQGLAGNDVLLGGSDDDLIDGGEGDDFIDAGEGSDTIYGLAGMDFIFGWRGDDLIDAGEGDDWIFGEGGADILTGGAGNDIFGEYDQWHNGDTIIDFSIGDVLLIRDADIATFTFSFEGTSLTFSGAQTEEFQGASMTLAGAMGAVLTASAHPEGGVQILMTSGPQDVVPSWEALAGTSGSDAMVGGEGRDQMAGLSGDDTLTGGLNGDQLFGGAGNDILSAETQFSFDNGSTFDELYGGAGDDIIFSGLGDIVDGGDGFDTVGLSYLGAAEGINGDTAILHQGQALMPGAGTFRNIERFGDIVLTGFNDKMVIGDQEEPATVRSWDGDDHLIGQEVSVTMYGGNGNDLLVGSTSADVIYGESGDDRIIGYSGADGLWGGEGADRFMFTSVADSGSHYTDEELDFIGDWQAMDSIDLSGIDADPLTAGDQAFKSVQAAFGFPAGEQAAGTVVIGGFGGTLFVSVFIDGGVEPDMVIDLWSAAGESALTAANFIL
jgi:Ca2+-binding RTX toxin-like protein